MLIKDIDNKYKSNLIFDYLLKEKEFSDYIKSRINIFKGLKIGEVVYCNEEFYKIFEFDFDNNLVILKCIRPNRYDLNINDIDANEVLYFYEYDSKNISIEVGEIRIANSCFFVMFNRGSYKYNIDGSIFAFKEEFEKDLRYVKKYKELKIKKA